MKSPMPRAISSAAAPAQPAGRKLVWMGEIVAKQVGDDLLGITHDLHHPQVAVHAAVQERLDRRLGLDHLRRERRDRLRAATDRIGRRGAAAPRRREASATTSLIRREISSRTEFRASPALVEPRIGPVDAGDDGRDRRHLLQIVDDEQTGAQAIVDVVGVARARLWHG